jgi:LuxR family quorum-sensing system transcriptional regulator CciR
MFLFGIHTRQAPSARTETSAFAGFAFWRGGFVAYVSRVHVIREPVIPYWRFCFVFYGYRNGMGPMTDSLSVEQPVAPFIPLSFPDEEGAQDFARMVRGCTELVELCGVLGHVARQLGFDHFALTRHLERRYLREESSWSRPLMLDDYPQIWKRLVASRRYFSDDPILAVAEKSAMAFVWSDIEERIELTARQREIMNAASVMGLDNGFTVPVHIPGDCAGACSFVTRRGTPLPWDSLPTAQYIGLLAFDVACRLTALAKVRPPRLTKRQFDCIVLVAQGKSDWDVGRLLGISDQTVHKHIEDAKRRYGVATRIQLVVGALFDNRLTFGDILAGHALR